MAALTLCTDSTTTGTSYTWIKWNTDYTCTTATSATWEIWNIGYSASGTSTLTSTATCDVIWRGWNSTYAAITLETTEQRQARQQAKIAADQQRKVIHERAEKWLRQHLNETQEEQYLKDREFVVHSRDGQRRYLITAKDAWVYELDTAGKRIRSFCIHSRVNGQLPIADEVCVKKLLLESDEQAFLKIANATRLAA